MGETKRNAKTRGNYPVLINICPICGILHFNQSKYCKEHENNAQARGRETVK